MSQWESLYERSLCFKVIKETREGEGWCDGLEEVLCYIKVTKAEKKKKREKQKQQEVFKQLHFK